MKKLAFRKGRNSRIRNLIVLGSSMILTVFVVATLVIRKEFTATELVSFGFLYVLICVPVMLMPFGNMLEWHDNGNLVTYYQIGLLKLYWTTHERPGNLYVEKDQREMFCLMIDFERKKKFVLERYSSRPMAEERLKELAR